MARKNTGPLREVVDRKLVTTDDGLSIRDTLECGHTITKRVSNSGNYADYNPADRRRCADCPQP